MAVSKYKMVRFLKKHLLKGILTCLLCVSTILSLTACCYPTSVTRKAERVQGVDEQDYLNSMFSGAMALTSLSTYELTHDYEFYDPQSHEDAGSNYKKGMHTFYDYADRQYTAMAQYLARGLQGMYGDFNPTEEFLWFEWDTCFDILNPHWYKDDPDARYSNDIWTYYYTLLESDPHYISSDSAARSTFDINHKNHMFHYACAQYEGLNYDFSDDKPTVQSLLHIYNNGDSSHARESGYQSNSRDTNYAGIQVAPIYVGGSYHYYVVSTEKTSSGAEQVPYPHNTTSFAQNNHLYDVMNANVEAVDGDDNTTNKSFLFIHWGDSYNKDPKEKTGFDTSFASSSFNPDTDDTTNMFTAWTYDNNEPNVKNIAWNDNGYYTYTYGIQLSPSDISGGRITINAPIQSAGQRSSRVSLTLSKTGDLTDSFLGFIKWDSGDYGRVSGGGYSGYYLKGAANLYVVLRNVKTVPNMSFEYIEFSECHFPLSSNRYNVLGALNDLLGNGTDKPIFDNAGTPNYYYSSSKRKAYMNVSITSTSDVTAVFNHRLYSNDASGTYKVNTITKWEGYGSSKHTIQKLKYALSAIVRYGGYRAAKNAGALDYISLNSNNYYVNILNTKAIGLSQYLYNGIYEYMYYDVIGEDMWDKSDAAYKKYFGSYNEVYAGVFAANSNKQQLSYYKGYDIVIPRIIGSMFALYNTSSTSPYYGYYSDSPNTVDTVRDYICRDLEATRKESSNDDFDIDNYSGGTNTLFPTIVAARIYTYGNVSALNRMYNYQNGVECQPTDYIDNDGVIHEDKIGAHLYYATSKSEFENGNVQTEIRTLEQYLYGIDETSHYTNGDKDEDGDLIEYYVPDHKGILSENIVTEYRIKSLILFPKLTLKDPAQVSKYGDYICIDPTFIMSAIGQGDAGALVNTDTFMRMNVEVYGSYTKQGVDEDDDPVYAAGSGVLMKENIVNSLAKSYSHSTVVTENGNIENDVMGSVVGVDSGSNQYILTKDTTFYHVKGNEFYTDVAVEILDENGNSVRYKVYDEANEIYINLPTYYKEGEVDKYGNVTGTPAAAGATVKLYDNYTREVYMYTDDYLYFKTGLDSGDESKNFSLYTYSGANRKINPDYFVDKLNHNDKCNELKYDSYNIRAKLFEPTETDYRLNTDVVGAYIKIDFTYWKNANATDSGSLGYKIKEGINSIADRLKKVDDIGDFFANLGELVAIVREFIADGVANIANALAGREGKTDSFQQQMPDNLTEGDMDYVLDEGTTGLYLFEISIFARDCGEDLMSQQGPEDFPVDMRGDYVVRYETLDGKFLYSEPYDGRGIINYFNINTTNFKNWFYSSSPYTDYAIDYYKIDGTKYTDTLGFKYIGLPMFRKDLTVIVYMSPPDCTFTFSYNYIVLDDSSMSWSSFASSYSSLLPATFDTEDLTYAISREEGDTISLNPILDLGTAFELVGWRVYDGTPYGAPSGSYTTYDADDTFSITSNKYAIPMYSLTNVNLILQLSGGQYIDPDLSDDDPNKVQTGNLSFGVKPYTKLSDSVNISVRNKVQKVLNNYSHPMGYTGTWLNYSGTTVSTSTILNTEFTTDNVAYSLSWDVDSITFISSFVNNISISADLNSNGSVKQSVINQAIAYNYNDFRDDDLQTSPKNQLLRNTLLFPSSVANFIEATSGNYYLFLGYTTKTSGYTGSITSNKSGWGAYKIFYDNKVESDMSTYISNNSIITSSSYSHITFNYNAADTRVELYALYQKLIPITFNNKGTESTMYIMNGTCYNDGYKTGSDIPNLSGVSNFIGWTTNSDVENFTVDDMDTLISVDDIKTTKFDSAQTYYAVYKNARVVFRDTVTNTTHGTYDYVKGDKIDEVPTLPSGATCWSLSDTSKDPVDFSTYVLTNSTTTLYACHEYTINYYYHDASGNPQSTSRTLYNNQKASNLNIGNASFKHWSVGSSSTDAVDMNTVKHGNYSLYAVYQYVVTYSGITSPSASTPSSSTYTVAYNSNSYTVTLPSSANYSYETATHIYTFEGWVRTGGSEAESGPVTITSSVSFTAKYTVTEKPTEP